LPKSRCAAFFVSPVAKTLETRIGAAVWAPGVEVPPFHPSGYMDKAPARPLPPAVNCYVGAKVPAAADGCKNIRLSADAA
jgi:hypothetical protein